MIKIIVLCFSLVSISCSNNSYTPPIKQGDNDNFNNFYTLFIEEVKVNDFSSIKYPIDVMCYSDKSRGGLLDSIEFYLKKDYLFPDSVIYKLQYEKELKSNDEGYTVEIGFSEWDEDAEMKDEFGIHYHFKKVNEIWKMVRITCLG